MIDNGQHFQGTKNIKTFNGGLDFRGIHMYAWPILLCDFGGFWASTKGSETYKNHPWIHIAHLISQSSIPSRKLTYPTWGSSENHLQICLINTYHGGYVNSLESNPPNMSGVFFFPPLRFFVQKTWNHPWPPPTNARRYGGPPTSVEKGRNSNQNKGHLGFQVYIDIIVLIYLMY